MRADRHPARGVAAIEFAITMIFLLPLLFGGIELGRAIWTYNTLDKSARDATRFLSLHGAGDVLQGAPLEGINVRDAAQCIATYGNYGCSGEPLVAGLTKGNAVVRDSLNTASHANVPTDAGAMNLVSVTIEGFQLPTLFGLDLFGAVFSFGPISTTMRGAM